MTQQPTRPAAPPGALYRLNRATGTLLARKYRIEVTRGPDTGAVVALDGPLIAGTHEGAGLHLRDSTVSRYHVELSPRPEGVRIRDLQSTNGTYVGGIRIYEVVANVERDTELLLGETALRISVVEEDLGRIESASSFGAVLGQSARMREVFGILERVAPTDVTILLLGETGTGKDLLAETIHAKSKRKNGPFVIVDCGAMAANLIESELFGHVKGAFTGAIQDYRGAFLRADGGTLFLDEIGELPLDLQPKLLRALESQHIKRLGEHTMRSVDIRIIAATNRELDEEVRAGRFRSDLYYRLAVLPLIVPPLRERAEDIPLLVGQFIAESSGLSDFVLSQSLWAELQTYAWPGNVRELRNFAQRVLAGGTPELPAPLKKDLSASTESAQLLPFKEAKERLFESFTREYLRTLFDRHDGNISKMARTAGIARAHMHRLLRKHGVKRPESAE